MYGFRTTGETPVAETVDTILHQNPLIGAVLRLRIRPDCIMHIHFCQHQFYKKPLGPSFFLDYSLFTALFFFSSLYYDACRLLPDIRSSMPSKFCSRSHGSYKSDGPVCAAAYKIHRDIHSVPGVFRPARSTVQHYKHCRCESFHQTPKAL